jgi:transcriptional regulator with XRE-family HTH domain
MDAKSLVAWNLRRLRVAKKISQDELALRAEVERAYVGHLERGTKNPTIATLEKLVEALNSEMTELFRKPPPGAGKPAPLQGGRRKG